MIRNIFQRINLFESKNSAIRKYVETNLISPTIFEYLLELDPSLNGKYIEKICQFYLELANAKSLSNNTFELLADAFRIYNSYLKNKVPLTFEETNIQNINSFKELLAIVNKYRNYKSKSSLKRKEKIDYETYNGWKIIPILSKEEAIKYGANTKWCIAATKSKNYFNKYRYSDNITFYILINNKNEKYAMALSENGNFQMFDENDKIIESGENLKKSNWLKNNNLSKYNFKFLEFTQTEIDNNISKDPSAAYNYAVDKLKQRWPLGEKAIGKRTENAYYYAKQMIGGRFPEGEKAISKSAKFSFDYAIKVLSGRFPEGEKAISKSKQKFELYSDIVNNNLKQILRSAEKCYYYAIFLKRRWPEGEKTITKSTKYSYYYARDVIGGRWPDGEKTIGKISWYAYYYAINFIGGRFPEGEKAISEYPPHAIYYARDVIGGRWPECEPAVLNSEYKELYLNGLKLKGIDI